MLDRKHFPGLTAQDANITRFDAETDPDACDPYSCKSSFTLEICNVHVDLLEDVHVIMHLNMNRTAYCPSAGPPGRKHTYMAPPPSHPPQLPFHPA